ncbi:O10A5 protein, partial [Polypterus senegalus]|nr:O10A5 protein [Polypterus senegalus]
MSEFNQSVTTVVHLILTGFLGFRSEESRRGLFGVVLTTYLFILLGNCILILIFTSDRMLHTPMYVLICGLAVLDIAITATIVPTVLAVFAFGQISVPFVPCVIQMIFHMGLFTTECFHLANEESRKGLFGVVLTTYLFILHGNFILIVIFTSDRSLHTPMYVLICGLALLDIGITTTIMPTMLAMFTFEQISVLFVPCIIQMIFHMGLFTAECFHLALMAYDRYLAICKPLYYPNLMYNKHVLKLMACCWVAGFFFAASSVTLVLRFPLCRPINIGNCFCDVVSLLFLACGDIVITSYIVLLIGLSVTFIPLLYILFSYVRIIWSVLRIPSSAIGVFISDKIHGASMDIRIMGLIIQNVSPPLMNPVIYCLRTKEIQNSFVKMLKKFRILPFSVQEYKM